MKKLTLLLILLIGSLSYGQEPIIIYQNAPDRQKITEFEKRNDSIVLTVENSPTAKVYIGDIAPDISGKADLSGANFTGPVEVPTATSPQEAVNLGQLMDSLATVEIGAGITSQYMDSDKTLEQSDFGKYIYTDESIELTIDNTPAVSSKIGLKPIDIDSTITVIPDGVTFTGDGQDISQGFIVDSLNLATVFKLASNLYSVDGVYKPYVSPGPFMDPAFVAGFWAEDLGEDESLVETWVDRTGNGNDANQSTSANRPKVNIEVDGKKAVDFDGVNDGLSIAEVSSLDFSPGNPITIVVVTGEKDFSSDAMPLFKGNNSSSTTGLEYGFYSSGANNLRGNVYGSESSNAAKTTNGVDVWIVASDGVTAEFFKNGVSVNSWSVGSGNISSNIWIGSRLGSGKFFNGSIRAVGISDAELSQGQMDAINSFAW